MRESADHEQNFDLALKNRPFDWMFAADRFYIGKSKVYKTNMGGREIYIESRDQKNGDILWVVKMDSWVLNITGTEYFYEAMPSERDEQFIKDTRFLSKQHALTALLLHEKLNIGKTLKLCI